VINLTEEMDTDLRHLWVSYYRSEELFSLRGYPFGATITIKVNVVDREGLMMEQTFRFKVETEAEHEGAQGSTDVLDTSPVDPEDSDLEGEHDTGIQVHSGDLAGAKIIYNSDEPLTPTFDSSDELPPLDVEGVTGVGIPVALQPHTVFSSPVKIFIPCPGYSNLTELCVMLHNGEEWVAACDENGEVLSEGEGWMVPGSRVNHDNDEPPTIEIQVYHFSAVQAAADATIDPLIEDTEDVVDDAIEEGISGESHHGSGAGCFIGTASPSLNMGKGTPIIFLMCALAAVNYMMEMRKRKNGYLRQPR
jgi:hypothetical protein